MFKRHGLQTFGLKHHLKLLVVVVKHNFKYYEK